METLKAVAAAMWEAARRDGRAERTLSGGLRIIVKIEGATRKLALSRSGQRVEYQEASICKAAFGVPAKCWPEELPMGRNLWKCYTWDGVAASLQKHFWYDAALWGEEEHTNPADWGEVEP